MSIGERITTLRKEHDLSQGDLAKALGVSRQAVSKWENDQSSPDTVKLIQLADTLATDVEYLATGRNTCYGKQSPVVLETVQTVEKIVKVPVVQVVEKVVEKVIEKPVIQYVEKTNIQRVKRIKYVRNPIEFMIVGIITFLSGLLIGVIIS